MPSTDEAATGLTLYCSFCGKSQSELRTLIAGPMVFICNECVLLCLDIVIDSDPIGIVISTTPLIRGALEEVSVSSPAELAELVGLEDRTPLNGFQLLEALKNGLAKRLPDSQRAAEAAIAIADLEAKMMRLRAAAERRLNDELAPLEAEVERYRRGDLPTDAPALRKFGEA